MRDGQAVCALPRHFFSLCSNCANPVSDGLFVFLHGVALRLCAVVVVDHAAAAFGFAVAARFVARGEGDVGGGQVAVGDLREEVADDVEAGGAFVVAVGDEPRRPGSVGGGEHIVARLRVVVPAAVGFDVHR